MAVDTTELAPPTSSGFYPGEVALTAARESTRPGWLRPNILWAIAGYAGGWFLGHWLGDVISGNDAPWGDMGTNNVATVLGLSIGVVGWLAGIGALKYPLLKLVGREPAPLVPSTKWTRYFQMTEDHKVVGLQY
ncbi:MAG: hypothetical protein ACHQNA_14755, partial [Acidimicrobiales bacterium]